VLILVLLLVSFTTVMFYLDYLISLTHLCFIAILSLYIVLIDVLIYSAAQLQECLMNLLRPTYYNAFETITMPLRGWLQLANPINNPKPKPNHKLLGFVDFHFLLSILCVLLISSRLITATISVFFVPCRPVELSFYLVLSYMFEHIKWRWRWRIDIISYIFYV